jgi:phospholipase D1/2
MTRKESTLSSGTFSELPTIPQAKVLGPESPLASDEFDFAANKGATENEPPDYLNGGIPHDRISPHTVPTDAPRPPALNMNALRQSTAAPEGADPSSPVAGRKSVQFTQDDGVPEPPELPSTASSPTALRHTTRAPRAANEGSDDDADAEETADETAAGSSKGKQKKRRRMRKFRMESYSVPTTPQVSALGPDTPDAQSRLAFLRRPPALTGVDDHGFSEGEGRDRLAGQRGMRRGNWMSRPGEEGEEADSPAGLRVGHHFRRLSALGGGGGGVSDGDAMSPRRPFFGADRASTFGVQKWRQVKGALKLLRQKKDEQFDFSKSAELMAELFGGAPAVLMLASMIQRDEHGNKRIPVLLEQLRLRITESTPAPDKDSERHWMFTMELEYGSGPSQMKWTIKRTIKDILNLHWKYKLALRNEGFPSKDHGSRRPKQPRFPLSAFPYLRGVRGLDDNDEEELGNEARAEETAGEMTAGEATVQEGTDMDDRPPMRKKRSRMPYLGARRKTSTLGSNADLSQIIIDAAAQRRNTSSGSKGRWRGTSKI